MDGLNDIEPKRTKPLEMDVEVHQLTLVCVREPGGDLDEHLHDPAYLKRVMLHAHTMTPEFLTSCFGKMPLLAGTRKPAVEGVGR